VLLKEKDSENSEQGEVSVQTTVYYSNVLWPIQGSVFSRICL